MWCAECGEAMRPLAPSGWARCCRGRGYWTYAAPLPGDVRTCRQLGVAIVRRGDLFFYPGPKWPAGRAPAPPK